MAETSPLAIRSDAPLHLGPVPPETMPTVLRVGAYRMFFYSSDRGEPPHVHIERAGRTAKFWLNPVRCQETGGFPRVEIRRLRELVERHQSELLKVWYEFFAI